MAYKVKVFQGPIALKSGLEGQINAWAAKNKVTIISTAASSRFTALGNVLTLTVTYQDSSVPKPTGVDGVVESMNNVAANMAAYTATMQYKAKEREKKLAAMTDEQREAFLAKEKADGHASDMSVLKWFGGISATILVLCFIGSQSDPGKSSSVAESQASNTPIATATAIPKPTATPTKRQQREYKRHLRRQAEQERREARKAEREAKKESDAEYAKHGGQSYYAPGTGQEGIDRIAYQMAVIDTNGSATEGDRTTRRFKFLLGRLSSVFPDSQERISDITVKGKQLLAEAGVNESCENMMEGINQVLPERLLSPTGENNQKYSEYIAAYVTARQNGESHEAIISALRQLTGN